MEISSNVKLKKSGYGITSAPTDEDTWIQPSVTQQNFLIGTQNLIDGIYIQVRASINGAPFFDSELKEIEAAAIADFWNIEETEE